MYRVILLVTMVLLTGCTGQQSAVPGATPTSSATLVPAATSLPHASEVTDVPPAIQQAEMTASPVVTFAPTEQPALATATESPAFAVTAEPVVPVLQEYAVPDGSHPHDVAPAPDGSMWYTAQASGELGRLDPRTGDTHHIRLGDGSAPHGVIVGPDGAPWITDGGLNAIVRVDPSTEEVQRFPLPEGNRSANLNTVAFDGQGVLWFTGQNGIYGRLDPGTGEIEVFDAPGGR